ncbi:MAG: NAD(P)-dependent oxidoreductase [Rubrivivax sp.]|nr:NAD(P)-dependent oxidoreductase [Rubrivivax sp.]
MKVGWIGLGHIGAPMARRVLDAGFALSLWARRQDAADALRAAGAGWCDDDLQLARDSDIVCTCVGGPGDVAELHTRLMPQARPGTLFIELSTAAPRSAEISAALARQHGLQLLDAPVSGGVAGAGNGTLSCFVGGPADALVLARPLLAAFSQRIVPCGEAGAGYRTKLVNQTMIAGVLLGLAEGATLARAAGIDAGTLQDALGDGSARGFLFDAYLPRMMGGAGPVSFSLGLLRKDLRLARDEARSHGLHTRLLDTALSALDEACTRHGEAAGVQMLAAG